MDCDHFGITEHNHQMILLTFLRVRITRPYSPIFTRIWHFMTLHIRTPGFISCALIATLTAPVLSGQGIQWQRVATFSTWPRACAIDDRLPHSPSVFLPIGEQRSLVIGRLSDGSLLVGGTTGVCPNGGQLQSIPLGIFDPTTFTTYPITRAPKIVTGQVAGMASIGPIVVILGRFGGGGATHSLLVSTDNGRSFAFGGSLPSPCGDPRGIARSGGAFWIDCDRGLVRSVDGRTWTAAGTWPVSEGVMGLAANDSVMFVAATVRGQPSTGIWISRDTARTWIPVTSPDANPELLRIVGNRLSALASDGVIVIPLQSDVYPEDRRGIMSSRDFGTTWTFSSGFVDGQAAGDWVISIALTAPVKPHRCAVYASDDGFHWRESFLPAQRGDNSCFDVSNFVAYSDTLYVARDDGIYSHVVRR